MLDTSEGEFQSHSKILAADFDRIRFLSVKLYVTSYLIISVYFLPRPAILMAEGDGWTSLCSFADRRAGSMSVLGLPFVCVGIRARHVLCTKKVLNFWRSSSALALGGDRPWGVDPTVRDWGTGGLLVLCGSSYNQAGPWVALCPGDDMLCPGHIYSVQLFRLQNRVAI